MSDRELVLRAANLARSAPKNFDEFLGALAAFTNQSAQNCIQAPLEELPRAQGRAQQSAHLYNLLANCLKKAAEIEGKNK